MPNDLLSLVNLVYLLTFVAAVTAITVRIGWRLWEYRREHIQVPRLLLRDLIFFGGLAIPFVGILLARVLGTTPALAQNPWWVVISGAMAVGGALFFLWYEMFRIEK